jgi:hypothetical protein
MASKWLRLIEFLTLVCPRIVIIVEDYSGKMNWNLETATDDSRILKQTSLPGLSFFAADILYTSMTPKDVVYFCTQMGYIPQQNC